MGVTKSKCVVIDGPGGGRSRFVITDQKVIYPNLVKKTELVGTIEGQPVGIQVETKPSTDLLFTDEKDERRLNCNGLKSAMITLGKLGIEYTFDPQAITVRLLFRESETDCFSFEFFVKWDEFSPFGSVYSSDQMEATIDLISGYVDLHRQLNTDCGVAFDISYYFTRTEMHRNVETSRGSNCFEEAIEQPDTREPTGEKKADDEPRDPEPSDEKPSDEKPSDEKPSDEKPSDEKPSDEKPSDEEGKIDEPPRRPVEFTLDVPRILRGMIDESLKIVKVTTPVMTEKDPRQVDEGRFFSLNNRWLLYVRIYRSKPENGMLHFRLNVYNPNRELAETFECRFAGLMNMQIVRFNTKNVKLFVKPKKHISLDESLGWLTRYVASDQLIHRFTANGMMKLSFTPLDDHRYYTKFTTRFNGENFAEIRNGLAEILPVVETKPPPTPPKPAEVTGRPPAGRPPVTGPRSQRTRPRAVAHG